MQGIFVCLIAAGWALLIVSLLFSSVRLTLSAKLTLRGGAGRLTVEWLFFSVTLHFRLSLARRPYMTLELVKKDGSVRTVSRLLEKEIERELPELPVPDELGLHITAGIKDEPAAAALICGLLSACARPALEALLPAGWTKPLRLTVRPSFYTDACHARAKGMIVLTPAQIIAMLIQMRRRDA